MDKLTETREMAFLQVFEEPAVASIAQEIINANC